MQHKTTTTNNRSPQQAHFQFNVDRNIQNQYVTEFHARKKHKPKFLSPDIFRWGRGLPRERVGDKKFSMSFEAREINMFGRDIPGFCWDIPAVPEKI